MANGRLYGLESWNPGRICGQILVVQALFYAALAASTALGCFVLGVTWPPSILVSCEYYSGAWPRRRRRRCRRPPLTAPRQRLATGVRAPLA